jgi:hypothetical protein
MNTGRGTDGTFRASPRMAIGITLDDDGKLVRITPHVLECEKKP